MYIHEHKDWPHFTWSHTALAGPLAEIHLLQGRLLLEMENLGFAVTQETQLQILSEEAIRSSAIEGEVLNRDQVRSSMARKLGIKSGPQITATREVDGFVSLLVDATKNFDKPLTRERLFGWQGALFPTGRSGMRQIRVGVWRDDADGPMQVVSGPEGRRKVHFEAPPAAHVNSAMKAFLDWFNSNWNDDKPTDWVLKAAVAHLWFVTIHPFEDGNGRIARAIADMGLARSEKSPLRFYSMSSQIAAERKQYYEILEASQKQSSLDITPWLAWFLRCLNRAIQGSNQILSGVLKKSRFWQEHAPTGFNPRQKKVLNRLLEGFGPITSTKWARIAKCSQDTAARDIDDLVRRKILKKNAGGGRSTSYSLL